MNMEVRDLCHHCGKKIVFNLSEWKNYVNCPWCGKTNQITFRYQIEAIGENEISRCESCNKYFKDEELEFVKGKGVICSRCGMED